MYIRYEATYRARESPSPSQSQSRSQFLTRRRTETLNSQESSPARMGLGRADDEAKDHRYQQQQQQQLQELGLCQQVDCSCVLVSLETQGKKEFDFISCLFDINMLINEKTAISSSRVLLVPYYKHHVPRYHEWMKDPEIQEATASEPLSEEEEYRMQASWRQDADKLTFIICLPIREYEDLYHQSHDDWKYDCLDRDCDSEKAMLGDVNMFLTFDEEEDDNNDNDDDVDAAAIRPPPRIVGELELLIAERKNQKCGYGRSALLCFLFYILRHEDVIVRGFLQSKQCNPPPPPSSSHGLQQKLAFFCVKIGANNTGSIRLFESLGFTKIREQPNVFGELELRRTFGDTGRRGIDEITELMEKYDVKQTTEVPYQR